MPEFDPFKGGLPSDDVSGIFVNCLPALFDPFKSGLPSDEVSERFMIATAIQWDSRLREAIVHILPEHLSLEAHRIIWHWVCASYDAGQSISGEAMIAHFSSGPGAKDIGSIGGFTYMAEFVAPAPDLPVADYISKILDTYARRCLMFKCNDALSRLKNRAESIEEIAHDVEESSRAAATIGKQSSGFKNFEDMIRESGGFEMFLRRGKGEALSYPWPALSQMTHGGMRPGQFIVIAGPSGKGKTALALNILFRATFSGQGIPLLFSLEMPIDEIGARMLSLSSGVDSYRFDRATDEERENVRTGRLVLAENQYLVDDDDCTTMAAIAPKRKP